VSFLVRRTREVSKMLKLVAGAVVAAAGVSAKLDGHVEGSYDGKIQSYQGTDYKVDVVDSNVAGTQEGSVSPIGVTGSPDTKLHTAQFNLIEAIDKYDAKAAAAGYKTSVTRSLQPKLAEELSSLYASDVAYFDRSTDNPLQQYIAWGGKMDYTTDTFFGEDVAPGMAGYFMDTANPVMNGVGPNQIANIDYGSAAGVKYLVATVENFKPLALKDLYVDFSLSLDGEEFYYQIYELALAVDSEGKIVAIGATNGRDMKALMQNEILPKVISAAKKSKGAAMSETELVEVRRSYAALAERRERIAAMTARKAAPSQQAPAFEAPMSVLFALGLFSSLLGVTFVGSRFMNTRTVNIGNPLLGEP